MKILEYKPIKINLDDLKYDEANPNEMNEEQMQGLRESMTKYGYLTPIIIGQNNIIADGEHRAKVYKEFNKKEIMAFKVHFKDDNERKMLRQTMNKLRGQHDPRLDAIELGILFKDDKLTDLSGLIAQNELELKRIIAEYHPDDTFFARRDLGEDFAAGHGSLAKNWGISPFTVLDRTSAVWTQRRNEWYAFGINSKLGRNDTALYSKNLGSFISHMKNGKPTKAYPLMSVFDPVLAEISLRWFCVPETASVLDPFAGGSVRGLVSTFLGHYYTGIDLRQEQVDANYKQYELVKSKMPKGHKKPKWIVGDSLELDSLLSKTEKFDFLLTCPPYFNLETYSNNKKDLSMMKLQEYTNVYSKIISLSAKRMKPNTFISWSICNIRDPKDKFYLELTHLTIDAFKKLGFGLWNELVVLQPIASMPFRATKVFVPSRIVLRRHEFMLIFYNGTKESIKPASPRRVEIPEVESEQPAADYNNIEKNQELVINEE